MFPSAGPAADAAGPAFLCPPPGGPGLPASVYAAEVIPPPAGGRETSAPPCVVGTSSISLALPRAAGFVLFAVPPLPTEPVGTVGTPTPCRKKQRRARWKRKGAPARRYRFGVVSLCHAPHITRCVSNRSADTLRSWYALRAGLGQLRRAGAPAITLRRARRPRRALQMASRRGNGLDMSCGTPPPGKFSGKTFVLPLDKTRSLCLYCVC